MKSQACISAQESCFRGQGGDEIFGGYARYLIAYFEQCIKGVDGTLKTVILLLLMSQLSQI